MEFWGHRSRQIISLDATESYADRTPGTRHRRSLETECKPAKLPKVLPLRFMKWIFVAVILLTVAIGASTKEPVLFFTFDKDNFSATGKWVPADPKQKPAFLSETQIDCFRGSMTCVEASAEFYVGYPHATLSYFQVLKWDKDGIVATSSSGTCMTITMLISFAEKSISSTHSMKQLDDKTKEACKFFGAEKTEEDVFVVRGSERWNKEHSFLPEKSEK